MPAWSGMQALTAALDAQRKLDPIQSNVELAQVMLYRSPPSCLPGLAEQ